MLKSLNLIALLVIGLNAAQAAPFQGMCNGVTDDTPSLNSQLHAQEFSDDHEISFPSGQCAFYSQPDPIIRGMSLLGQSKSTTVFIRKYSGSFLTIYGNGSRIENLTIYAAPGTAGGIGIYMIADESHGAGGNHDIENVWITGNGTWDIPIFGSGTGKTNSPKGLRTITLRDVNLFNAKIWAFECWDCVGAEWFGGGAYQGFGTTQAVVFGGAMSAGSYVNANIDYGSSIFWAQSMRPR